VAVNDDHGMEFTVPAAMVLSGIRLPLWSRLPRPHRSCNKEEATGDEVVSFRTTVPTVPVSSGQVHAASNSLTILTSDWRVRVARQWTNDSNESSQ
jgi:hypothetical protein